MRIGRIAVGTDKQAWHHPNISSKTPMLAGRAGIVGRILQKYEGIENIEIRSPARPIRRDKVFINIYFYIYCILGKSP